MVLSSAPRTLDRKREPWLHEAAALAVSAILRLLLQAVVVVTRLRLKILARLHHGLFPILSYVSLLSSAMWSWSVSARCSFCNSWKLHNQSQQITFGGGATVADKISGICVGITIHFVSASAGDVVDEREALV